MLLCWPGGLVGSICTLKASSLASFVTSITGAVTLLGRPRSVTFAGPSKGVCCVTLQKRSVDLPCSAAALSILNVRKGGATSSVASCDETQTGPLPTVATPRTAVFHLRTWALAAALTGKSTSVAPSGMTTDAAEPTPGGLKMGVIVMGALKPGLRSATILRFIEPFCTRGTLGSTILILNGTSSATATAARSTSCLQ